MCWAAILTAIFTGVMAAAVIAGVLVARSQLRKMVEASRSQACSSLTDALLALDKLIIMRPDLEQLLHNVSPTGDDAIKQKWLVSWYLDLYEDVYFEREQGVIVDELWQGWENEIRDTCKRPGFKEQYPNLKKSSKKDLQDFIEPLMV